MGLNGSILLEENSKLMDGKEWPKGPVKGNKLAFFRLNDKELYFGI